MYYKCENSHTKNVNNIDLKLRNKLRRPMHYNIGATKNCGFNGHTVVYFVVPVITRTSNPPISQFSRPCNEFMRVWWMFPYNRSKIASYHVIKDQHLNSVLYKKTCNRIIQLICRNRERFMPWFADLHSFYRKSVTFTCKTSYNQMF